jgi:hypothetical protein
MLQKISSSLSSNKSPLNSPIKSPGSPSKRNIINADLLLSLTLVSIKRVASAKVYSLLGFAPNGRIVEIITFNLDVISVIVPQLNAVVNGLGTIPFAWFQFRNLSVKSPGLDSTNALEFMFEMSTKVSLGIAPPLKLFSFEEITWPRMGDGDSALKMFKFNTVLIPLVFKFDIILFLFFYFI